VTSYPTATLGEQRFVSLTTFKRVQNNPRVLLAPSSRFGKVRDGVSAVEGAAQVVTEPAAVQRLAREIRRKYGLQYRLVALAEMIATRGRKPRVIVRIALSH
jgi:hypothetical protein